MFLERCSADGGAWVPEADMRPRLEPLYCSREKIVLIRGLHWNLNLREAFEQVYGEPRAEDVVRFVLKRGALVLSRSVDVPPIVTGEWPGSPVFPLPRSRAA